jgi:K+-sensing histidine kinase KdpD
VDIDVKDDGPGIPERKSCGCWSLSTAAITPADSMVMTVSRSISRVIAEAHSGSLILHDAEPLGLIVRLTLPKDH